MNTGTRHLPQLGYIIVCIRWYPHHTPNDRWMQLASMAVLSVLASLLYFVPALSLGLTVPAPPSAYQKVPKIVMGNDDGWAEANIRQLYYDLDVVGYEVRVEWSRSSEEDLWLIFSMEVILSAPAYNMSGTGSTDIPLEKIRPMLRNPAEYDSVPAGSPSIGNDTNDRPCLSAP